MLLTCITYIILFYIVLLINHEQGARINDKEKRLSPSEWLLKQSKRHKRKNTLYTAIVLLVALVLLIFAVNSIQVEPVKVIRETKIAFVSHI